MNYEGTKKNNHNSFTILEVMLAISILTLAIGGSFSLIQQTLVAASSNQSKLIAYYLSQEGIEIVRNIRDSNWLQQKTDRYISWDKGLADGLSIGESRDYIGDFNDLTLRPFEDKPLNMLPGGFYGYSLGTPTTFKRKISIKKIGIPETGNPNDYGLKISVQVQFSERGRTHKVEVLEELYNWYGYGL